jgi:hypothetical protein
MQVQCQGVPIQGLSNTDTVVQRAVDAIFPATGEASNATIAIPITMVALNMAGTVPGPNGGTCTVTLTLAPSPASTGMLTLTTNAANTGGSYTSEVLVHFIATFTPGPPTCYPQITGSCKFRQKGGHWGIKPLPNEFLVTGPYGDVQANFHTSLPPGFVDFYITKPQIDTAAIAAHATCEALQTTTPCQ